MEINKFIKSEISNAAAKNQKITQKLPKEKFEIINQTLWQLDNQKQFKAIFDYSRAFLIVIIAIGRLILLILKFKSD